MPESDDELEKAMEADEAKKSLPASIDIVQDKNLTPYEMMDRQDEEQILAELDGIPSPVLEEMVYSFQSSAGRVTGLSWVGVKTLIVEAGHYEISDIHVIETEKSYRVVAKAHDIKRNVSLFGMAEQPKMMKTKSGEMEDTFALQKASSKAQRNALQSLLPKKLVAEFVERCMKAKNDRSAPKVRYG